MKLKKFTKSTITLALGLMCLTKFASAENTDKLKIGVVDFRTCIEKSYLGQEEQTKLEAMRNEMINSLEDKNKLLTEVMDKLKKPEFLDTISPEAEEKLQKEYAQLSEEIQYMQNQAYQALNEAQMRMFQTMNEQVQKSSEYLAREHGLDLVINQEHCFYYKRPLEMTQLVIQELNRHFQPDKSTAENSDSE